MTTAPAETTAESTDNERGTLLRKAYGAATTALREKHRDEFEALYVEEAQKLGVDYKPKPTAEQKAEQELRDLLEKFPHLRETLTADQQAAVKEFKTS
jgi:hypothetical protein